MIDTGRSSNFSPKTLKLTGFDRVYRVGIDKKSREVELSIIEELQKKGKAKLLRDLPENTDTYINRPPSNQELRLYTQAGLPAIPFVEIDKSWSDLEKKSIMQSIEKIGGFPVVLKKGGHSHGEGVSLIYNYENLKQNIKDLGIDSVGNTVLKRYIERYRHFRLVIVAGRVAGSIEYMVPKDDFRTNATDQPVVKPYLPNRELKTIAEKTAVVLGTSFGGIDILYDLTKDKPFIAEFNDPCNFARVENTTGEKISEKVLDYLFE